MPALLHKFTFHCPHIASLENQSAVYPKGLPSPTVLQVHFLDTSHSPESHTQYSNQQEDGSAILSHIGRKGLSLCSATNPHTAQPFNATQERQEVEKLGPIELSDFYLHTRETCSKAFKNINPSWGDGPISKVFALQE